MTARRIPGTARRARRTRPVEQLVEEPPDRMRGVDRVQLRQHGCGRQVSAVDPDEQEKGPAHVRHSCTRHSLDSGCASACRILRRRKPLAARCTTRTRSPTTTSTAMSSAAMPPITGARTPSPKTLSIIKESSAVRLAASASSIPLPVRSVFMVAWSSVDGLGNARRKVLEQRHGKTGENLPEPQAGRCVFRAALGDFRP